MAHGRGGIAASFAIGVLVLLPGVVRAAEAPVPVTGNAARGLALFTGATPMQNGGAACGACHAIGGHGPLLAASLGPDLSRSFDGMPVEAVDGLLNDLPFPTMAPIYAGRALTPQERADLGAFLVATIGAPSPGGNAVAGIASGLAVLLLALMGIRARHRKVPTRGTLVARPPAPARRAALGRRISAEEASNAVRSARGGSR